MAWKIRTPAIVMSLIVLALVLHVSFIIAANYGVEIPLPKR
jgi:hypothetical protein